jgi:hypothetical protein
MSNGKKKNKNKSEHASDDANRRDTVDELVSRDSAATSALPPLPLPRPRNDQRCLIANVTVLSMYSNPKLRAALERFNLCDIARGEDSDRSDDEAIAQALRTMFVAISPVAGYGEEVLRHVHLHFLELSLLGSEGPLVNGLVNKEQDQV